MATSYRLSGSALDRDRALSEVAQFLQELQRQVAQHEKRIVRLLAEPGTPLREGPGPPGLPVPRPVPTKPALPWDGPSELLHADSWAITSDPPAAAAEDEGPPGPPELPGEVRSRSTLREISSVPCPERRQESMESLSTRPTVAWAGNVTNTAMQARIDNIHKTMDEQSTALNFQSLLAPNWRRSWRGGITMELSKGCLARVIESSLFDTFIMFLIVTSAACLGIQMEWEMQHLGSPTPVIFNLLETFFTTAFTAEIVMRMVNERVRFLFWSNPMLFWNIFDTCVVSWCLICKALTTGLVNVQNVSFMRLFRVLRIFRAFRLIRVMKLLSDVRIMVAGIVRSFGSLLWALLLLAFIMYLVAVCIMQAVHDELHHQHKTLQERAASDAEAASSGALGESPHASVLLRYYGSLLSTMYTLFMTISGGIDWGDAAEPLKPISSMLLSGYCLYIAFSVFCVLNVITGVFVDNATKFTQGDKETELQEEFEKRLHWFAEVQRLFYTVDNGTGMMTLKTFHDLVADIEAQVAFSKVGIELDGLNVEVLFRMLDFDGSGAVDINEFITGLEMYHGNAKRMDIARLMRETKKINKQMAEVTKLMEAAHNIV